MTADHQGEVMCPCGCGETYEEAVGKIQAAYMLDRFTAEIILLKAADEAIQRNKENGLDNDTDTGTSDS